MEPLQEGKKRASQGLNVVIRGITGDRNKNGPKAGTSKKGARMFGLANAAGGVGIVIDGVNDDGDPMDTANPKVARKSTLPTFGKPRSMKSDSFARQHGRERPEESHGLGWQGRDLSYSDSFNVDCSFLALFFVLVSFLQGLPGHGVA